MKNKYGTNWWYKFKEKIKNFPYKLFVDVARIKCDTCARRMNWYDVKYHAPDCYSCAVKKHNAKMGQMDTVQCKA